MEQHVIKHDNAISSSIAHRVASDGVATTGLKPRPTPACRSASNPDHHRRAPAPSIPALRRAAHLQPWRARHAAIAVRFDKEIVGS